MSGMLRRGASAAVLAGLAACAGAPETAPWIDLFDGRSRAGFEVTAFGGEGPVDVDDGAIVLDMGSPLTGVTWSGEPPHGAYELEVTAARLDGTDFFCGLTFPVGSDHLTLVLGGWGGSVSGLSSLDGIDANSNQTRRLGGYSADTDYTARIAVNADEVRVWLDDEPLAAIGRTQHELSLRPEVRLCRPLGIASFATRARVRLLRWRPLRD
jgi:hypothetical protein